MYRISWSCKDARLASRWHKVAAQASDIFLMPVRALLLACKHAHVFLTRCKNCTFMKELEAMSELQRWLFCIFAEVNLQGASWAMMCIYLRSAKLHLAVAKLHQLRCGQCSIASTPCQVPDLAIDSSCELHQRLGSN
jgi:hypothetical protein